MVIVDICSSSIVKKLLWVIKKKRWYINTLICRHSDFPSIYCRCRQQNKYRSSFLLQHCFYTFIHFKAWNKKGLASSLALLAVYNKGLLASLNGLFRTSNGVGICYNPNFQLFHPMVYQHVSECNTSNFAKFISINTMSVSGMLSQIEPSSNSTSWQRWFFMLETFPRTTLLQGTTSE